MKRIVRGAALIIGCAAISGFFAGCSEDRAADQQSTASLTAAVLSKQDLPSDFLPTEDQQVFRGVGSTDPDCRRLLDLADLRGLRDVPQSHAVFYRATPGATLAEHVVVLGSDEVRQYLKNVRKAAANCRTITIDTAGGRLRLRGEELNLAPFPALGGQAYGVQYAGRASDRYDVHFDLVMVPVGDWLLVLAQPTLIDQSKTDKAGRTEQIANTAVRKLQAAPSATGSARH